MVEVSEDVLHALPRQGEHDVSVDRRESATREQAQSALGDFGRVVTPDGVEMLRAKRLHAERHERDADLVKRSHDVSVDVGGVGLDADVARQVETLPDSPENERHALEGQRRSAAAHVDAGDLARPDLVGPPVDLGDRGSRVPLHELGPVRDLGVRAVRAAVATEGNVKVERGPLDPRRRPRRIRAHELPALLGADQMAAQGRRGEPREPAAGPAHQYRPIASTALGRSRSASTISVHAAYPQSSQHSSGARQHTDSPSTSATTASGGRRGQLPDWSARRPARRVQHRQSGTTRREQPIDDRRPLGRIEIELVSAVVRSLEVEHDADDRQPRVAHPRKKRLDAVGGVSVDDVDDRGLGMARRANRRLDLGEVIASAKLVGAGQPVDADPHQVRRAVEPVGAVGVEVDVEEADPARQGDGVFDRVRSVPPQRRFATREVDLAKAARVCVQQHIIELGPGHVGAPGVGDLAPPAREIAPVRDRYAEDEGPGHAARHGIPRVLRVVAESTGHRSRPPRVVRASYLVHSQKAELATPNETEPKPAATG